MFNREDLIRQGCTKEMVDWTIDQVMAYIAEKDKLFKRYDNRYYSNSTSMLLRNQ